MEDQTKSTPEAGPRIVPIAGANQATGMPAVTPLAVTLDEAGKMLGVCGRTVLREIERGHLKGLKVGHQWRVRLAELQAYLKRQEQAQESA